LIAWCSDVVYRTGTARKIPVSEDGR
jgi:hypothetical protein